MLTQKLRIQKKIVELLLSEEFPVVTYDANGSPQDLVIEGENKKVATPKTPIIANEIQSSFSTDPNNGRAVSQLRDSWTFTVRVGFDSEVCIELFEDKVTKDVPKIPVDKEQGLPFVQLKLVASVPVHPVQQQGASGTTVEFTFEAEQGRQ